MTVKKIIGLITLCCFIIGVIVMLNVGSKTEDWIIQLPFQGNKEQWGKVDYQGLLISDKTLEGIQATQSDFKNFVFEDVVFKNCHFNNVSFQGSTFKNVVFENVTFEHPYRPYGKDHVAADDDLSSVHFSNVIFKHCNFKNIFMEDSFLDQVRFEDSYLDHMEVYSLGGDVSLINSSGTDLAITSRGEMNYQQSGGFFNTILIDNKKADFVKFDKTKIGSLDVYGSIDQFHITQSRINYFAPGLNISLLGMENSEFNVAFLDTLQSEQVVFSQCNINEKLMSIESKVKNLLLIDSHIQLLDFFGKSSMGQIEIVRTPLNNIEIGEGRISKLTLKQIALPSDWKVEDNGSIELLEIKQPLFPKSFRYQGKNIPQCYVQLGANSQVYTDISGQRLPEILKKQIVLETRL